MKKLLLSTIVPAFVLTAFHAAATPVPTPTVLSNSGLVTITWKVSRGSQEFSPATPFETTNKISSKQTNYVSNYKAKTTTSSFATADLLALLTNSFKTNFSKPVKLATDGFTNIYVVDKTGTNVFLDVSPVLRVFPSEDSLRSGGMKTTMTVKSGVTNVTSTLTDTMTSRVTLHYNDSGELSNNVSDFWFHGVTTISIDGKFNGTNATGTGQLLVQDGSGGGTIQGTNVIISGTISGSIKGTSAQYGGN